MVNMKCEPDIVPLLPQNPLPNDPSLATHLTVKIRAWEDNLNENSQLHATIGFKAPRSPETFPLNLVGIKFKGIDAYKEMSPPAILQLSQPTYVPDIVSFTLSFKSHPCDEFNCDNFDVAVVDVNWTCPQTTSFLFPTQYSLDGKQLIRFKSDGSVEKGNPVIPVKH